MLTLILFGLFVALVVGGLAWRGASSDKRDYPALLAGRPAPGAASPGGPGETKPQGGPLTVDDPAWLERQLELGSQFMLLWLAPWGKKRTLLKQEPDLADPARHAFAKLLALKSIWPSAGEGDAFLSIIDAHEPLLARCDAALREAEAERRDASSALDVVFADEALRAEFERRVPAGLPSDAADD